MDCDKCIYQGNLENSRHSTCNHPQVRFVMNDSGILAVVLKAVANGTPIIGLFDGFRIERDQQGIDGDWCLWPFNFDPIWIKECTGFEEEEKETILDYNAEANSNYQKDAI